MSVLMEDDQKMQTERDWSTVSTLHYITVWVWLTQMVWVFIAEKASE